MGNDFYSSDELCKLGLIEYGQDVHISRHALIFNPEAVSIGNNVRIDAFAIISGKVSIGSNVHIAAYCALYGSDIGIHLGDFSNLSSRVSVYSRSDDYSGKSLTNPTIPEELKCETTGRVTIGRHVIIGSTSVILPGCDIAEGGSFGAFSLINRDTEPWTMYAGIPVRKKKERNVITENMEERFYEFGKKWGDKHLY